MPFARVESRQHLGNVPESTIKATSFGPSSGRTRGPQNRTLGYVYGSSFHYGMLRQLHPVTSNVHASPAPQNPLHSGASASPHGVVRHSQAPPEVIAEQCPPLPQVPSQRRSSELKSQELGASVVLVVVEPVGVAGAHRN